MTAITITDLNNAALDVGTIAAVATSTNATVTDRLGNTKDTLKGAIDSIKAFNSRGAWATATAYAVKDLVSNSGNWYVCVVAHTSSAAFATDAATKWRVYQGQTAADVAALIASTSAPAGVYTPAGAGAVPTTVQAKLRQHVSVQDKGATGTGTILDSTDSTSAIAAVETESIYGAYVPNGIYNTTAKRLAKKYYGPGVIRTAFDPAYETGNPLQTLPAWTGDHIFAVDRPAMVPPSVLRTAAASGALKAVWMADSIGEGADAHYSNTMPQTVLDALRKMVSWIDVSLVNLSLSGYSMGNTGALAVANAGLVTGGTFYRSAPPHTDQLYGLGGMTRDDVWPQGSTSGQTWLWHVQQQAPDIVFIALGTNDPSEEDWLTSFNAVWATMQTWAKVPFIVLVPPAQPSRSFSVPQLKVTNSVADCMRAVSMFNGFGLIDVNAISRQIADGEVSNYGMWLRERNFIGWADSAVYTTGGGTLAQTGTTPFYPGVVTFTGTSSIASRLIDARDVDVSMEFKFGTSDAMPFVCIRTTNNTGYLNGVLVRLESNASALNVFIGATPLIGVATGLTVTTGQSVRMRVRCVGGDMTVWVGYGNTPALKGLQIPKALAGYVNFGYNVGNGQVSKQEIQYVPYEQYNTLSPKVVTDDQLFGTIPGGEIDARDNEVYYGGDANHHPSSTAAALIYVPAVLRWVHEFVAWLMRPHTITASITAARTSVSTTPTAIAGSTVTVTPRSINNFQSAQCRFDISLPYTNSATTGNAAVSLCSGPDTGPQTVIHTWPLTTLTVANKNTFQMAATLDLLPGTQSYSLQWSGTNLAAGTALAPITLSATLL